ncbi:hypothetical protein [Levilactobacillus bambusae]|uniref:Uncharacterized protein n=1 Tax=Levilactobacillus bambusae TaxID=2024736 RepID=A0A2V1MZI7_9LACO|nr:hypothetical protein [Levilactobacillus bambusae]PWG00232.1 hypothetical protein DCM90_04670 [Levilactobacillus bambusae]
MQPHQYHLSFKALVLAASRFGSLVVIFTTSLMLIWFGVLTLANAPQINLLTYFDLSFLNDIMIRTLLMLGLMCLSIQGGYLSSRVLSKATKLFR